jgi:hypothetical protein
MVIPKLLHQIWIGPRPAPRAWIETWRAVNTDFRHRLWTDERIDAFGLRNDDLYRRFLDAGLYDGAADVARVEILHRHGGVYADADSVALRPLDRAPFMRAGFFAPREPVDVRDPPLPVTHLVSNARSSDVERLPAWTFFTTSLMGEPVSSGEPYARHLWSTTAERARSAV